MDFELSEEHRLLQRDGERLREQGSDAACPAGRRERRVSLGHAACDGTAGPAGAEYPREVRRRGGDQLERGHPAGGNRPGLRVDGPDRRRAPRAGQRAARAVRHGGTESRSGSTRLATGRDPWLRWG